MATPLSRLPEPGDGSPQAAVSISAVTEYLLPATMRGIAAQAMAALAEKLQSMSQDIAAHASKTAGRRQRQHAVPGRREP